MTEQYEGIFPAIVTAYDRHGDVDPMVQKQVARWLIDRGCKGLFVCGGTGEGLLLTEDERKLVLEAVTEEVGNDATIIAHVGSVSPLQTYRLAEHAAALGADAIAAIPGTYFTPAPDELIEHYTTLAEIAQRPTLLYHIPIRTGVSLDLEIIRRLAEIPHVAGLKYTDHNLFMLEQMRKDQGDEFIILSGADEMMVPAKLMGSTGAVGTWYNVMPDVFVAAFNAAARGDWDEAMANQKRANWVMRYGLAVGGMGMVKAALEALGFAVGDARMPVKRLDDVTKRQCVEFMQSECVLGHQ